MVEVGAGQVAGGGVWQKQPMEGKERCGSGALKKARPGPAWLACPTRQGQGKILPT